MSDESASEWEGSGAEDASDDDFASAKPAKRERPAAVAQEQQNPQKFAKTGTKTPTSSNSAVSGSSGAKKSVQSTPTTANAKGSAAAMKVSSSLASVPLSGDANSEGSPPKTSAASTGSGQTSASERSSGGEVKGAKEPSARPSASKSAAPSQNAKSQLVQRDDGGDPVLAFVNQLSAPLNAQMVADQFRTQMSKAAAEKHLLALAESEKIVMKENGKSKIFYARQDVLDVPSEEELARLGQEAQQLAVERQGLSEQLRGLKAELASARRPKKTLQDWHKEQQELLLKLASAKSELAAKKQADSGEQMTEKEADKVIEDYCKLLREYKKRRGLCLDMLDKLSEGMCKSRKELVAEFSLETDEDYNVQPNQFPILQQKARRLK